MKELQLFVHYLIHWVFGSLPLQCGWMNCAMKLPQSTLRALRKTVFNLRGLCVLRGSKATTPKGETISLSYFKKYNYTSPAMTGLIFVGFVIFMDLFLVSMIVMKSFEMFASLLGTWIPFALIFTSTYLTGMLIKKNSTP